MLYQLSNGRTVYLTVEEFLNLTHEEEQYLISIGYGEIVSDPFAASFVSKSSRDYDEEDDLDIPDDSCIDDIIDIPDEE